MRSCWTWLGKFSKMGPLNMIVSLILHGFLSTLLFSVPTVLVGNKKDLHMER